MTSVEDGSSELGIDVYDVRKSFKRREILRGASIAVRRGSVAVLQGANGSGKTTLLRILATVITPDQGSVRIAGIDARRQPHRVRERIGVAFVNERSIYWRLNALENLKLFAATRGVPQTRREAEIDGLAGELGMEPFLKRRISDLSTGQRQRIILARAGLGDPDVLLVDEPLRGLDETGVEQAIAFMTRRTERGATVLIASPTVTEMRNRGFALSQLVEGAVVAADWT